MATVWEAMVLVVCALLVLAVLTRARTRGHASTRRRLPSAWMKAATGPAADGSSPAARMQIGTVPPTEAPPVSRTTTGGALSNIPTHVVPVQGGADLDRVVERSRTASVWLFKHDPFCSFSLVAFHEVKRFGGEVALVDVARQRALSMEIAARTGIRHESPQLLLLEHGHVVWSASHLAITTGAMRRAIAEAH